MRQRRYRMQLATNTSPQEEKINPMSDDAHYAKQLLQLQQIFQSRQEEIIWLRQKNIYLEQLTVTLEQQYATLKQYTQKLEKQISMYPEPPPLMLPKTFATLKLTIAASNPETAIEAAESGLKLLSLLAESKKETPLVKNERSLTITPR